VSLALAGGGRFGDRVLWTRVQGVPVPGVPVHEAPVAGESRIPPGELRIPPDELRTLPRRVPHSSTASRASARGTPPGGVDALRRLAASVGAAARRCGIDVEDRPYRPHLTLARGREGADLRSAVEALSGFAGSPWTADALHLVRSRLGAGPGGTAAHEVIETWSLSPQHP
jgi:hypothetical protein